jgi:MFS family permease
MRKPPIRESFPSLFLLINSVVWFSLSWLLIQNFIINTSFENILFVSLSYFGALLLSAVVGATLLNKKLVRKMALLSWVSFGAVTCLLSAVLVHGASSISLVFFSIPLGALAGLGIPTCLALFSEVTISTNRGRSGAIVFFLIQVVTVLIYIPTSSANIANQFLVLAAWRIVGVLSIFFWVPHEKIFEKSKSKLLGIIRERTVFLLFIPWFLLTIVNFVEQPILQHYFGTDLYNTYQSVEILIIGASAFVGGVICDFKGRKVSGIIGFILLGVGYAFLSLLSGTQAQVSQILWVLCDGVAWGFLYVTFIFVVWGDISQGKAPEKYYLLGGIPFLLSNLISVVVQPFVKYVQITTSFSLASFFLFVAILPLLYVPESLPEKALKDRDLKSYLEKAQKLVQKETGKNKKQDTEETKKEDEEANEETQESPADEEARKLAEKYY